jgi:hypothetical protein
MAGIAAEALNFAKAEGGAVDEDSLKTFLTNIQPPWNILRIQVLDMCSVTHDVLFHCNLFWLGSSSMGRCPGYSAHSRAQKVVRRLGRSIDEWCQCRGCHPSH